MIWNRENFPAMLTAKTHAVVAFSGGLDTSLCVLLLRREVGCTVTTVTVDTGGFDAEVDERRKHAADGAEECEE